MNHVGTLTSNGRSVFLDHAKAIAIILMVLLHTTSRYVTLTNVVEAFHMAVFFLIGGVFFKPTNDLKTILRKGFTQLIIPYLSFSIFALTICWISPYLHPELYPGLDTFGGIMKAAIVGIFVAPNYYTGYAFLPLAPLWFLLALFGCRLLFYYWAFPAKYVWLNRLSICVILGLILYLRPFFLSLTGMAVSFPFFVIGYYARELILTLPLKKGRDKMLLFIISLLILLYFDDGVAYAAGRIIGNVLIAYVRGIAGCVLLLLICTITTGVPYLSDLLAVLGVSTLSVLGLHFHLIYPAKVLYAVLLHGDVGAIHISYAIITTIIVAIILSYVNKCLTVKTPYIIGKMR